MFVCSLNYYRHHVLPELQGDEVRRDKRNFDFGVLLYPEDIAVYAELTHRSLDFQEIKLGDSGALNYNAVISFFSELKNLGPGQWGGSDGGILRWEVGLWKESEKWANTLEKMFPERTLDAAHVVLFYCDAEKKEDLHKLLAEVKKFVTQADEGESLWDKYGIQGFWFGGLPDAHAPTDGALKGLLRVNVDAPTFVLYMHFRDYDGLKRFEEDNKHSAIRQAIYQALDKRTSALYRTAKQQKTAKAKAEYYEDIELVIGHQLKRWDFLNRETILQMVTTVRPFAFGGRGASRARGITNRSMGGQE